MPEEEEEQPSPPNVDRCLRNDGKGWQCRNRLVSGRHLCKKHILLQSLGLERARAKVESRATPPSSKKLEESPTFASSTKRRLRVSAVDRRPNTFGVRVPAAEEAAKIVENGDGDTGVRVRKLSTILSLPAQRGRSLRDPYLKKTPKVRVWDPISSPPPAGEVPLKKTRATVASSLAASRRPIGRPRSRAPKTPSGRPRSRPRKVKEELDTLNQSGKAGAGGNPVFSSNMAGVRPGMAFPPPPGFALKQEENGAPKSEVFLRIINLGDIWTLTHGANSVYGRIDRIIPTHDLVQITLLTFHPVSLEEMHWAEENVSVSCGIFCASKLKILKPMSALLQLIFCASEGRLPGLRLFYSIFPKKGEIWAVYMKLDGSEVSPPIYEYVEVISDFSVEAGSLTVAMLVAEAVLEGDFRRQMIDGCEIQRSFSRRELLRFSHRIQLPK